MKLLIINFLVIAVFFLMGLISAVLAQNRVDVQEDTKTTIIKDVDGDGIYDREDPNPDISEIYIVEDNNKNGIVDSFENQ